MKKLLTMLLALCMVLSCLPAAVFAVEPHDHEHGFEEELVVNAAGDSKDETIPLEMGMHSSLTQKASTVYYSFTAASEGTVKITITPEVNSFTVMYYPNGAGGSYVSYNLDIQPEQTKVNAGDTVVFGVKLCTSKWGAALAGNVSINVEFTPTGGGEPTCDHENLQDDGDCTTAVNCPVCGEDIVAAKTAHTPAVDDGDCTTAVKCANAGCTKDAVEAKTAHAYKNGVCQHVNCEAKDPNHTCTGGSATCTNKAVCDICGEEYGELADHDYNTVATSPTCTEDGYTTYTCTTCGDSYVGNPVEALGHAFEEGVCTRCGAEEPTETPLDAGDNAVVSGTIYAYTATEDCAAVLDFSGLTDSKGSPIYFLNGNKRIQILVNGVAISSMSDQCVILQAGQKVTLQLVSLDEDTYTATAKLTVNPILMLNEGQNTIESRKTYLFTATQDGQLYLSVLQMVYNGNEQEADQLGNMNLQVNGKEITALDMVYDVKAGDEILIFMDSNSRSAVISLSYTEHAQRPAGCLLNPIALPYGNMSESIEIPVGTSWYQLQDFQTGRALKIFVGENNITVKVNGSTKSAVDGVVTVEFTYYDIIEIINNGEETVTCALNAFAVEGSEENPKDLTEGDNSINLGYGKTHYYDFLATQAGTATVTVTGDNWKFIITHYDADGNVLSANEYRAENEDTGVVALELKAGEKIVICVGTAQGTSRPSGTINTNFAFEAAAAGEHTPVVKIGDQEFFSVQEAINAAQDGDVLVLQKNIVVDKTNVQHLEGKYYVFFIVEGKSITIDLNGCELYGNAAGTTPNASKYGATVDKGEMLLGMFVTNNNGHLVLKDRVGTGMVSIESKDANVYALAVNYSSDSTIVVEGGNYFIDEAYDCVMYSACNEGVIIKGGNFRLGNLGKGHWTGNRGNGSPWMFNAKGRNEAHVLVLGGTFNSDLQHQYWLFDVEVAKEVALVKNGTWTCGDNTYDIYASAPAVCYITWRHFSSRWYTQNLGYATVQDAMNACMGVKTKIYYNVEYASEPETIVMLKDVELTEQLTIGADKEFTLDLNGKTISMIRNCTDPYAMLVNLGKLTIQDSVGGGKLSFTDNGVSDGKWSSNTIENGGILTVESGIIERLGTQTNGCAIFQTGRTNAVTTINGGTISAPSFRAVRVSYGSLVINDGTFNGQIWMDPAVDGTGLTINGGTFNVGAGEAAYFVTENDYKVELKINVDLATGTINFPVPGAPIEIEKDKFKKN